VEDLLCTCKIDAVVAGLVELSRCAQEHGTMRLSACAAVAMHCCTGAAMRRHSSTRAAAVGRMPGHSYAGSFIFLLETM